MKKHKLDNSPVSNHAAMRSLFFLLVALIISTTSSTVTADLKPFEFQIEVKQPNNPAQKSECSFSELKLPTDFSVFAAGAYSGRKISFQIDQSGHDGTQIDVAVNSPNKPVVLMLGAYEPHYLEYWMVKGDNDLGGTCQRLPPASCRWIREACPSVK